MTFDIPALLTAIDTTPIGDVLWFLLVGSVSAAALLRLRARAARGGGKPSRSAWFDEV